MIVYSLRWWYFFAWYFKISSDNILLDDNYCWYGCKHTKSDVIENEKSIGKILYFNQHRIYLFISICIVIDENLTGWIYFSVCKYVCHKVCESKVSANVSKARNEYKTEWNIHKTHEHDRYASVEKLSRLKCK